MTSSCFLILKSSLQANPRKSFCFPQLVLLILKHGSNVYHQDISIIFHFYYADFMFRNNIHVLNKFANIGMRTYPAASLMKHTLKMQM